ncbi:MAG: tetratricopeptide repeat protein [Bryobacteraceae bacterium]|nr:tetratricopeptide repeat protein [Bryobacteraceae bacterium]
MIALRPSLSPYFGLAVAVLAAFGLSLSTGFAFDDYSLFSDPAVASASGWREIWRFSQTRPLTYLTFWANHMAGGRNPWGYHAVNVAVHLVAVLLAYNVLSRLAPRKAALIAAAIFALHPIQTEPVAYIFERATLLATALCLVSWRYWLAGRHWTATAWFAAALLAKEECAAFPVVLLLFHLARRGRQSEWKPIAAMMALALAAGLRVIAVAAHAGSGAGFGSDVSPLEYFLTQGIVIARYIRLLIIPYGFTVDPEVQLATDWRAAAAWCVIAVAAAFALRSLRAGAKGLWFLAGLALLLPSSSIFPIDELMAERRIYFPLIGFAAAAALAIERLRPKWLALAGVALLALTVARVQVWQDERLLWREAVERAPGKLRPKLQLARISDNAEALRLLQDAKRIAPDNPAVAAALGGRLLAMGRPAEALPELGRALALAPRDPVALNNRGVALLGLGQREPARRDFERALALDPCLFNAHFNLHELGVPTQPPTECRYSDEQRQTLARGSPAVQPPSTDRP